MSPRPDSFSECETTLQGETEGKKDGEPYGEHARPLGYIPWHLDTVVSPSGSGMIQGAQDASAQGYPRQLYCTLGPAKLPPPVGLVSLDIIPLYGARFRLFVCRCYIVQTVFGLCNELPTVRPARRWS